MDEWLTVSERSERIAFAAALVLSAAILAWDLSIELGVASGVPYVAVVLATLWMRSSSATLTAAIFCSALTLVGLLESPAGGEIWKVLVNRGLALFAIWTTAGVIVLHRHTEMRLRNLDRTLLQVQRVESVGRLAAGMAHDLNNLLTAIEGNLSLARLSLPDDAKAQVNLEQAEQASARAAELTASVLAYAGRGRGSLEPVNLSRLAEETSAMFASTATESVTFQLQLDGSLPPVQADAMQLRQVLTNLVSNAVDALEGAPGTVTVITRQLHTPRRRLQNAYVTATLPAGEYAVLEVVDTGVGMDLDTQRRMFDPFYTTKEEGHGLGLGAVLGMARHHEGAVEVESAPGRGTTVRVFLPKVTSGACSRQRRTAAAARADDKTEAAPPGMGEPREAVAGPAASIATPS